MKLANVAPLKGINLFDASNILPPVKYKEGELVKAVSIPTV
jgi:hypothetical protein